MRFLSQDAQKLNFSDNTFDLVFSTCLLAHVDDPEKVMREAIRVTRPGGNIIFLAPTDPGIFNQVIKTLWTYPMMRRDGVLYPDYVYSKEHKNPIHNLLAIARLLGQSINVKIKYRPFSVKSWQLNLWVLLQFVKDTQTISSNE